LGEKVNMRRLRGAIFLALVGTLGTLVILLNPLYVMLALIAFSAFVLIARQVNFYKIAMMLKRFISEARRIYLENRLKLRTGFRDYSDADLEKTRRLR